MTTVHENALFPIMAVKVTVKNDFAREGRPSD